ncbi:MAG: alpha/beta hydrolase [Lentisphaerae bacterium]|nr:alpha/beta hydrolase [Lentisphaerota bacterium]
MMRIRTWTWMLLLVGSAAAAPAPRGQGRGGLAYPPDLPGARAEVYKTVGDVKLSVWIHEPAGHRAGDRKPAIVFFFGGGWANGSPAQFAEQCRHFASRGMVAMTADYRVATRHQAKVVDCIRDAKSAMRWVRANADRLGIDPARIAAGGGSAGGHLAACMGVLPGFDEPGEDATVSGRADAMVLFNPAMALAPIDGITTDRDLSALAERIGAEPSTVSPAHHVGKGAPPCIMFFGTKDALLPGAEAFRKRAREAGGRCEIVTYEGQAHGFFNHGRGGDEYFKKTLAEADRFLVSLGWLKDPAAGIDGKGGGQ